MNYLKKQFEELRSYIDDGGTIESALTLKALGHIRLSKIILEYLKGVRNPRFVELGCGGSMLPHYLSRLGVECWAVDRSEDMIEYQEFLKEQMRSDVTIVQADVFEEVLPRHGFHYVHSCGVIEHFPLDQQLDFLQQAIILSREYVHTVIPNYGEKSLFRRTMDLEDEEHLDCDLLSLYSQGGLRVIDFDGYCVVGEKVDVDYNSSLRRFLEAEKSFPLKSQYTPDDIEDIIEFESSLSKRERCDYGFNNYAIGVI